MGFGLVGLYLKSVLTGVLFTVFRNWLTLGGALSPGISKAPNVKASEYKTKRHG